MEFPPMIAASRSRIPPCKMRPRPVEMVTADMGRSMAVRKPAM